MKFAIIANFIHFFHLVPLYNFFSQLLWKNNAMERDEKNLFFQKDAQNIETFVLRPDSYVKPIIIVTWLTWWASKLF